MHKLTFPNNLSSLLSESLSYKDLEGLMKPTIHVDEFSSKMGDDDDIIVVSFFVRDPQAAKDLMAWFEKGYDFVLDADKSPGEVKPNRYLVYVEIRRRSTAGQHVETLVRVVVDDQAALVDLLRIDPLLGVELEVAVLGRNAEERHHALRFQDADALGQLAVDLDVLDERDAQVARLDVRVVRLRVEPLRDVAALFQEAFGRGEDRLGARIHLVLVERRMVAEAVAGQALEGLQEDRGQRRAVVLGDLEHLLGSLQRLVALGMADFGEDEAGGGGGSEADLDGHAGGGP